MIPPDVVLSFSYIGGLLSIVRFYWFGSMDLRGLNFALLRLLWGKTRGKVKMLELVHNNSFEKEEKSKNKGLKR